MLFSQFIRELQRVSDLKCAITKLAIIINSSQSLYAGQQKGICPPGVFTIDFGFSMLYYFRKKIPIFCFSLCSPETASLCCTPNVFSSTTTNVLYPLFFSPKFERFMENNKHFFGKKYYVKDKSCTLPLFLSTLGL